MKTGFAIWTQSLTIWMRVYISQLTLGTPCLNFLTVRITDRSPHPLNMHVGAGDPNPSHYIVCHVISWISYLSGTQSVQHPRQTFSGLVPYVPHRPNSFLPKVKSICSATLSLELWPQGILQRGVVNCVLQCHSSLFPSVPSFPGSLLRPMASLAWTIHPWTCLVLALKAPCLRDSWVSVIWDSFHHVRDSESLLQNGACLPGVPLPYDLAISKGGNAKCFYINLYLS